MKQHVTVLGLISSATISCLAALLALGVCLSCLDEATVADNQLLIAPMVLSLVLFGLAVAALFWNLSLAGQVNFVLNVALIREGSCGAKLIAPIKRLFSMSVWQVGLIASTILFSAGLIWSLFR